MSESHYTTLDDYNNTSSQRAISFKLVASEVIVDVPELYNVAIRKFKIPINKYRYIDMVDKPYYINIYCDLKEPNNPPGLVYGNNIFEITGPIINEEELILKMNDIVLKKAQPITLGRFSLEYVNNTPTLYFTIQSADMTNWNNFEVYIDERLSEIFNFQYTSDFMTHNDENLYKLNPVEGKQEQASFTFNKINKIDSIRIYTSLPIKDHFISNSYNNTFVKDQLLLEIYYNANQLLFSNDIIYNPTFLDENSMTSSPMVTSINLKFRYKYRNGYEREIYASKGDTSLCTLKFTKKI